MATAEAAQSADLDERHLNKKRVEEEEREKNMLALGLFKERKSLLLNLSKNKIIISRDENGLSSL